MTPCPWTIAEVLPHAPPMVLLDEVIAFDAEAVLAAVTIGSDHPFATAEGVPVHVGIELMAQACGAYAGVRALADGEPVRLGYLLGTRSFHAVRDWLRPGERLEVSATVVFRDDGMGVFDCRIIAADGGVVAEARLNLFQPKGEP